MVTVRFSHDLETGPSHLSQEPANCGLRLRMQVRLGTVDNNGSTVFGSQQGHEHWKRVAETEADVSGLGPRAGRSEAEGKTNRGVNCQSLCIRARTREEFVEPGIHLCTDSHPPVGRMPALKSHFLVGELQIPVRRVLSGTTYITKYMSR